MTHGNQFLSFINDTNEKQFLSLASSFKAWSLCDDDDEDNNSEDHYHDLVYDHKDRFFYPDSSKCNICIMKAQRDAEQTVIDALCKSCSDHVVCDDDEHFKYQQMNRLYDISTLSHFTHDMIKLNNSGAPSLSSFNRDMMLLNDFGCNDDLFDDKVTEYYDSRYKFVFDIPLHVSIIEPVNHRTVERCLFFHCTYKRVLSQSTHWFRKDNRYIFHHFNFDNKHFEILIFDIVDSNIKIKIIYEPVW